MDWRTLIFGSVVFFVDYYANKFRTDDFQSSFPSNSADYSLPRTENYDFIIVGGGTAGCALANRLSQNPNVRVLVLEAGGDPPPQTDIPAFAISARMSKHIVSGYSSLPQVHANNRVQRVVAGKVLGGTSVINYMGFNRGSPHDFHNWAFLTGDPSWNYDQVLQNFKNTENYQGEFFFTEQHGRQGEMIITKQDYAPGRDSWMTAGRERGYIVSDPNGLQQSKSVTPIEYNKVKGRRLSAYTAFLRPIEGVRPNLKVVRYANVNQVLIDHNNRAYGVAYKRHDVDRAAFATREVIVCAGAYGSPLLLQRSGLGPANLLDSLNITTRVNLPVGGNLQDHAFVPLKILITDKSIMFNAKVDLNENTVDDYLLKGEGPLTSTGSIAGQAFITSEVAAEEGNDAWPDVQLSLSGENAWRVLANSFANETSIFTFVFLQRPRSRGYVSLNIKNANDAPIVDFNILDDPRDVRVLVEAIKSTLEIFETTSTYKKHGAHYSPIPLPSCEHVPFRTDTYWDCYIRNTIIVAGHSAGTCPMGQGATDPRAVVDTHLRVIGVEGLRVVDASVMPSITNSNPSAAIYMIADKVSADIKKRWAV